MDEKLKASIEKIKLLAIQNSEFDKELRKIYSMQVNKTEPKGIADDLMKDIYEYCIEKIIRKQAEDFYKNFPLTSLKPQLIEDFIRMEHFRRKDNFYDFSLALYQQIEGITNKLCERKDLSEIVERMWAYNPYVKDEKTDIFSDKIRNRLEWNYTIAELIFGKNTNWPEKTRKTLQAQYANDKLRIVVYFVGYRASMTSQEFSEYVAFTGLLNDIYSLRNTNHRGNTPNEWEQKVLDRIEPHKTLFYIKFLGALAQYVDAIENNIAFLPDIKKYTDSLEEKKIKLKGTKVIGKIDLSN